MPSLTALKVRSAKAGRHGDGAGLYLLVAPTGARSWMLRVQNGGNRRDIGLGSAETVSLEPDEQALRDEIPILQRRSLTLSEARKKAGMLRDFAKAGKDPIHERDRDRREPPTFRQAAIDAHAELSKGWVPKSRISFLSMLEQHAFPKLGNRRVDQVDASAVRDTLAPVWVEKPATARKLRQRIGMVLDFANVHGWRETEKPTNVTKGLSKQPRAGNFAAMPYADVPAFVAEVRSASVTMGRLALLFAIATAARSGEVRSAGWHHIDIEKKLWRRPAELMKGRDAHDVTLNDFALSVLKQAAQLRTNVNHDALVFNGSGDRRLSDMTLTAVLKRYRPGFTVHGFRSSFRDWCAEMTNVPREIAEAALAHTNKNKVEAAYLRTDFADKRRPLLDQWGSFVEGRYDNVLRLVVG